MKIHKTKHEKEKQKHKHQDETCLLVSYIITPRINQVGARKKMELSVKLSD